MQDTLKSAALLFTLLNPFLLSIYLLELIHRLKPPVFSKVLLRASLIAGTVYILFALFGEAIFEDVLQVRFSSFLIFGGVIFFLAGIRFVFGGVESMYSWKGDPEYLAGSIAMPFLIGPATVSACVVMGEKLSAGISVTVIVGVIVVINVSLLFFKWLYDYLSARNEKLVQRYIEIVGRIAALYIGVVSVDMIFQGIETWLNH